MIQCPYCEEWFDVDVSVCPHCKAQIKPETATSQTNSTKVGVASFLLPVVLWMLGACFSFIAAVFSINVTVIQIFFITNVACLVALIIFVANRKKWAAILLALAPVPTSFAIVFIIASGLPFMSETISWDEDVGLADGRVLSVRRMVTYGLDKGLEKSQTISFNLQGKRIEWVNKDPVLSHYMPDILDFVDGMPVLAVPVYRWGACEKHGFPQEGLVAFSYRDSRWIRINVTELPKGLKVNLLRSPREINYWNKHEGKRIDPSNKGSLESGYGLAKQGQSILEASRLYAGTEESCARIHPLPDPLLEISKQQIAEAETQAESIVATVTSLANSPENISSEDFRKAKGDWTGAGYLSESCKGIVEKIEPIRLYGDGGSWSLVGHLLVLKNGAKIPMQQPNLKLAQAPMWLERVTCDQKTIYAIKRQSSNQLILHRFLHSGPLVDALRITLPDVAKSFPGGKQPEAWDISPANGRLLISLANYSYTQTANLGGIIEKRLNYTIQLPK